MPPAASLALPAIVQVCILKFSFRSNQIPSQRVAPLSGGGMISSAPSGVWIVQIGLFLFRLLEKCWSSVLARLDLDTALGRPLWAETGPAHGRAVGVLTLPGGLLRALTACPVGKNGRPRAVKQSKQEGTRDMHYLCSFWLYFWV